MKKIKIYADGAEIAEMKRAYQAGIVSGFTTNPTLMKKAGIPNYVKFAQEVLTEIPNLPISFEVFADTLPEMELEAKEISSWGKNVYIKIPIMTTSGASTIPLIKKLSAQKLQLNITAVMTTKQVSQIVDVLTEGTNNIISVFAGRIADAGKDPIPYMIEAKEICQKLRGTELLWASPREVLNIIQAEQIGVDIITVTPNILEKYHKIGKDLTQISLETVQMFYQDSQSLGYKVIPERLK
ncbi:MAG: transaldolase [Culicoidibacterales bacterium]